jgi:IS5 family transposase
MRQQSLAVQGSFEKYGRKTRREKFLEEADRIMPWSELLALIEPYYPKPGKGRPPIGLGIMLRVYFLQHWFNLSDPGAEEALYDLPALRRFAGVDLGRAPAPDETSILNFRHLLERHDLCGSILQTVNRYLDSRGIGIGIGTIVDATIIHAPSSTKNATGTRDPAMHQTRKGNQWYFGMKAHVDVDSREGIVHSVCATAARVADEHMLPDLLHGEERKVWGDAAYQGQGEMIREAAPHAQDMTSRRTRYKQIVDELQRRKNRTKARVRARVEHPFRILKRVFGFVKVRFRGLKKNHDHLCDSFALANLYHHRKRLATLGGAVCLESATRPLQTTNQRTKSPRSE